MARWEKVTGLTILTLVAITGPYALVSADRFSSASYVIDASVANNNGGGNASSSTYKMTSSYGENVIGSGASGSYKMGMGYVAQLDKSMTLAVQPSGQVGYWPFDENNGQYAYDEGITANTGLLQSGATWATGKIGGAVDVTNDDVRVVDNAVLPSGTYATIELWANQSSTGTNRAMATHWDYTGGSPVSAGWSIGVGNSAGTLRVFIGNATNDPGNNYVDTGASSWTSGVWHHVVLVFDGTLAASDRVAIYVDGVKQATTVTGTLPTALLNSSGNLYFGDFNGLSNRRWNGLLDQVKLFDRALTDEEVKAEYDAQNAGVPTGVTLGNIVAGVSKAALADVVVQTDAGGYTLAVNQNHDLTSGAYTIPSVSGTIAAPVVWTEGTTKGLGFTLSATNATAIPGIWNGGNSYAAFPSMSTTCYTRTGQQSADDYVTMRLRADVAVLQAGSATPYTNIVTVTGTITP